MLKSDLEMDEEGGFCLGRRKGEEGDLVGLANLVLPRRAERRTDLAAMAAMFLCKETSF